MKIPYEFSKRNSGEISLIKRNLMNPYLQIFLTASLTLFGGSILFLITKMIEHYYLKPLADLDELRVNVSGSMVFNANRFGTNAWDKENVSKVSDELRTLASKLRAVQFKFERVKLLSVFLKISSSDIGDASANLIGLSNSIGKPDFDFINDKKEKVETLLKIKV